ncbi:MAG TPA: signal recognition particle-docking protein FtsY [Anaerolineae bacterium]|nr:signal recognition particle-docking protein FtsY [Anaerolineae bacterium]HXV97935.1 signal recognition particle-docking protein FtsY [Anaerolineae bacterium]
MFSFSSKKIQESLTRTRNSFFGQIAGLFGATQITDDLWDDLEALLIQADVGVETTTNLVERVRQRVQQEGVTQPLQAQTILKAEMKELLDGRAPSEVDKKRILTVILVVGVNGSGKTTTIAKLANYYQKQGKRVILAAADTFRAAAIDQLKIWGERADVPVIAHQPNADPGAVVFDALKSGLARKADMVIIDTAGRLHTKYNLMKELEKLKEIARKQVHAAPHETLLVLDATTGQNALSQAKHFKDSVNISGVVLAKLDGTAKGGMVFAISKALGVPVRFVGTGEKIDDLMPFDAEAFVDGLFEV